MTASISANKQRCSKRKCHPLRYQLAPYLSRRFGIMPNSSFWDEYMMTLAATCYMLYASSYNLSMTLLTLDQVKDQSDQFYG